MGTSKSKEADQKQQQYVDLIFNNLKVHRKSIESISHTVEAQHSHVHLLSLLTNGKATKVLENECSPTKHTEDTKDVRTCICCTSQWQKYTRALLASIQDSLECQSDALLTSFKILNSNIHHAVNYYKLDNGTSVDSQTERLLIYYDNAPQINDHEYRKQVKTLGDEIDKLTTKETQLAGDKRELEEILKNERKRLKETEEELDRCHEDNKTLQAEKQTIEECLAEKESSELSAKSDIDKLTKDKEMLERQIKHLKEHRTVAVQLYCQVKGDIMAKLLDELKSMLVSQMGVERHELQFIVCQNERDVNPEIPLLALSINASRIGTDTVTALHDLNVSSKVSLLIFHHKDIHALPNQASDRVLSGPEFKALGGIFDIGFLAEKGMYPCDMNRASAAGIEHFLRSQS